MATFLDKHKAPEGEPASGAVGAMAGGKPALGDAFGDRTSPLTTEAGLTEAKRIAGQHARVIDTLSTQAEAQQQAQPQPEVTQTPTGGAS